MAAANNYICHVWDHLKYYYVFLHRAVRENQDPRVCLADRCLSLQRYGVVIFWKIIKFQSKEQVNLNLTFVYL